MTGTDLGSQLQGLLGMVFSNDIVQLVLRSIAVAAVVLWIAAAWWAYRDATARTGHLLGGIGAATAVILGTPLLFPLVVMAWMLARPPETLAEREERELNTRALEGAAAREHCPACEHVVDDAWRRCPWCGTWLLEPCRHCGRDVQQAWTICPWCAAERPADGPRGGSGRWVAVGPGRPAAYDGPVPGLAPVPDPAPEPEPEPVGRPGRRPARPRRNAPVVGLQGPVTDSMPGLQGPAGMIPVAARSSAQPRAKRTSRGR